jgi:hypothetical protein
MIVGDRTGCPDRPAKVLEMLQLSDKWAPLLLSQSETGMGYQIAAVFLRDGTAVKGVKIVGGTITDIQGNRDIPFKEEDIVDIQITHGR